MDSMDYSREEILARRGLEQIRQIATESIAGINQLGLDNVSPKLQRMHRTFTLILRDVNECIADIGPGDVEALAA